MRQFLQFCECIWFDLVDLFPTKFTESLPANTLEGGLLRKWMFQQRKKSGPRDLMGSGEFFWGKAERKSHNATCSRMGWMKYSRYKIKYVSIT